MVKDSSTHRFRARLDLAGSCSLKMLDHKLIASASAGSFNLPWRGLSACLKLLSIKRFLVINKETLCGPN